MICSICGKELKTITNTHLAKHGTTMEEYKSQYGSCFSEETKKKMIENRSDIRGSKNPMYGKIPWNKGKTKAEDLRVRQYSRSGSSHSQWKGGITNHSDGYVEIHISNVETKFYGMSQSTGHILYHRYVMAKHLDRALHPNELVHHKDGNKLNNDINNLDLCDKRSHGRLHYHETLGKLAQKIGHG